MKIIQMLIVIVINSKKYLKYMLQNNYILFYKTYC